MTVSEEEGGEKTPPTVEDAEPLELPETDSTQTSETGSFCSFIAMVTSCHGYLLSWLPVVMVTCCHGYQPRDTT